MSYAVPCQQPVRSLELLSGELTEEGKRGGEKGGKGFV